MNYIMKEAFKDGDIIIEEGFSSNYAYILLSGTVKVSKKNKGKKVVIGTLKEGAVFGEMGLLDQSIRTASVIAIGSVEVGMINKESFVKMLEDVPKDFRSIIKALVDRLKLTTEKLASIGVQLENTKKLITSLSLQTREVIPGERE